MKTLALYIASVKLYARMGISAFGCAVFLLGLLAPWTSAFADAPVTQVWYRFGPTYAPTHQALCDVGLTNKVWGNINVDPASVVAEVQTPNGTTRYACKYYSASGAYLTVMSGTLTTEARCADGSAPDKSKPLDQQCAPAVPNTCGGFETPELFAENAFSPLASPTCTWLDAQHINVSCSGVSKLNGRQTTWETSCRPGGNNAPGKIVPDPVPTPEPPVEVDYPDCPAGSYSYTDIDGTTSCTTPEPEGDDPKSCTSGNAGTVNGRWVCLPANPAPATASANESIAKAQADAAKAAPGTQTAADAAKAAAIAAQKAKDAANSLPTDQATQDAAQRAIDAAKQAAGHAGVPYTGPRSVGSGTGTGGGGTGTGGNNITVNVDTCGIPGKPRCQIDESGTPDGTGTKITDEQVNQYVADRTEQMEKKQEGWDFGWTLDLPQGACQPWTVGARGLSMTFDWCPYLEQMRALLGWFYMMITAVAIYGSFRSAGVFNKG